MAFVKVTLLVKEKSYTVEIDENADPQALIQGFVEQLNLPRHSKYRLHLVNTFKLHPGAILTLVEVKPQDLFRGLKENSES